jgi:hypothetical protein
LIVRSSPFGFGLAIGAAVTTHNGTVFAFPALLLLFWQRRASLRILSPQADSLQLRGHGWESFGAVATASIKQVRPALALLKNDLIAHRLPSFSWWNLHAPVWETHLAGWVVEEETSICRLVKTSIRSSLKQLSAFHSWKPDWFRLLAGFLIPQAIVMSWLLVIWIEGHGLRGLFLLHHFLRGVAPDPATEQAFGKSWWNFWWEQSVRTWNTFASPEVFGFIPLVAAVLLLLIVPPRKTLIWWFLAIPYLVYEMTVGASLDWGIYLVFIVPTVAASLAMGVACWTWSDNRPLNLLRTLLCAGGIIGLLYQLPAFQTGSEIRRLLPWYREGGATKALSDWVRKNSPQDSLVIQPLDWHFAGLASTLYTDRIPLFRDSGGILIPGVWRPLFCHPAFHHVLPTTTADFEHWLDTGRPILSFDADPFHTWSAYWPELDTDRYETRPILWLDRNQSGTSDFWTNVQSLASVDVGDPTAEARYHVEYSINRTYAVIQTPPYHPTLYRIARKTDPPDPPQWVKDLQVLVPECQRTPLPPRWDNGFSIKTEDGPVSLTLPTIPGRDHVLRLTLQSIGWDYVAECQVKMGKRWIRASRDMERITGLPDYYFTDLYLQVPARYVNETTLVVRLLPALGAPALNYFQIEWGVDKG